MDKKVEVALKDHSTRAAYGGARVKVGVVSLYISQLGM